MVSTDNARKYYLFLMDGPSFVLFMYHNGMSHPKVKLFCKCLELYEPKIRTVWFPLKNFI
jgi:hypothetical protein